MAEAIFETDTISSYSITKLYGDNFLVWKTKISVLFELQNRMGIVDGSETRPQFAGADQDRWDHHNKAAKNDIVRSICDNQVETVLRCKTAAEMWYKINDKYLKLSGEAMDALKKKYYTISAGSNKSPVKTMLKIQELAGRLKSVGEEISEKNQMDRILNSIIDEKYRPFREAWRSIDTEKQSLSLLLKRLQIWESEDEITCKIAVEKEEKAGNLKKTKEEIAELKKKTRCHSCNRFGHWKTECRQEKEKIKQEKEQETEFAMYCSTPRSDPDEWAVVTNASRHFCGKRDWFFDYEEYSQPKSVMGVCGSSECLQGMGKVRVEALVNGEWKMRTLKDVGHIPGGVNIFSEVLLLRQGYTIKGNPDETVFSRNGQLEWRAVFRDGLKIMQIRRPAQNPDRIVYAF